MFHAYFFPYSQKSLIVNLARRDVLARYRGSMLGLAWSFLTPLAMLLVYTFVFRNVFKARWPSTNDGAFEFALQVYAGLIVFGFFSEVVSRAPRLVLDSPNLVKKVVFPLEILPWVAILSGLFHFLVNLLALVFATGIARGELPLSILAVPLVVIPVVPLLLGIGWFLAALGVYLRDIQQITTLVVSLLMFLSPVFFPTSSLSPQWQGVLQVNPLTPAIEQLRRVVLDGYWPNWQDLGQLVIVSFVVAWIGARWFAATRRGFADVL